MRRTPGQYTAQLGSGRKGLQRRGAGCAHEACPVQAARVTGWTGELGPTQCFYCVSSTSLKFVKNIFFFI